MKKGDAYPPRFNSAATFGSKPRVITIECVRKEPFENDGKKTEKPVMYFKGERSGFVLGPTKWDNKPRGFRPPRPKVSRCKQCQPPI